MKTRFKYIHFETFSDNIWTCHSNKPDNILALIEYNKQWKCWEMKDVNEDAGFTADCLRDIAEFLDSLKGVSNAI